MPMMEAALTRPNRLANMPNPRRVFVMYLRYPTLCGDLGSFSTGKHWHAPSGWPALALGWRWQFGVLFSSIACSDSLGQYPLMWESKRLR
jgi:hypothetical protein